MTAREHDAALVEKARYAVCRMMPGSWQHSGFQEDLIARAVLDAVADDLRAEALREAADEIERELICCPDDGLDPKHHICRWGQAARAIVLDGIEAQR